VKFSNLNDYQRESLKTWNLIHTDHPIVYPTLGLANEAGDEKYLPQRRKERKEKSAFVIARRSNSQIGIWRLLRYARNDTPTAHSLRNTHYAILADYPR